MKLPGATWNPVPDSCFTKRLTRKSALCVHRMVGWANYMRTPHPEAVRRRISAHLTIDLDGGIQQHVDFDYCAHTQGIRREHYDYARRYWPRFRERNPNADCVSIELEDGGKPFTDERPMPPRQLAALIKSSAWILEEIIQEPASHNLNVISHDILTPTRSQDPGDWVMRELMGELNPSGSYQPQAASDQLEAAPLAMSMASPQSLKLLKAKIVKGERRCTFNDAVMLKWIYGNEAGPWSRRVWHEIRRHRRGPLAPWQGQHLYSAVCQTIMGESGGNPKLTHVNKNGSLPGGKWGRSVDRGLVQINDKWWPEITDEQAFDPAFSVRFIVKHFIAGHQEWWHAYRPRV